MTIDRAVRNGPAPKVPGVSREPARTAVLVGAAWIIGTNAAVAGEITGNGKWIAGRPDTPLNGKSECAYSGRQDDPGEPPFKGLIAQSWGQIPKAIPDIITSLGASPGTSCNPTKAAPPLL